MKVINNNNTNCKISPYTNIKRNMNDAYTKHQRQIVEESVPSILPLLKKKFIWLEVEHAGITDKTSLSGYFKLGSLITGKVVI